MRSGPGKNFDIGISLAKGHLSYGRSTVDSFDSSNKNFEYYSLKEVQESFRKRKRGHPVTFDSNSYKSSNDDNTSD